LTTNINDSEVRLFTMDSKDEIKTKLEQKGHLLLLSFLLLMILVSPFLHQYVRFGWLLDVIMVLIFLAAASTVTHRRRQVRITLILGVPALISQVAVLGGQIDWVDSFRYLSSALFLTWVSGLLLYDIVLRSHTVTLDVLLGAINVYLMIGVGFAFVYALIEHLQPGSFTGLEELVNIPDLMLYYIYFSFITLSTLGYGDISPLTPYGMTASYFEAILGQLYLAILLARLVAIYIRREAPAEK